MLSYRPRSAEICTILPFELTYHSDLPKIREIVDNNWPIIESSKPVEVYLPEQTSCGFQMPHEQYSNQTLVMITKM